MLWSEYLGIDQLVLKKSFIHMYEHMSLRTDDSAIETIIFDQGVCKYIRVAAVIILDQVYVTYHNCYWKKIRVGLLQVTGPDTAITTKFCIHCPYVIWIY